MDSFSSSFSGKCMWCSYGSNGVVHSACTKCSGRSGIIELKPTHKSEKYHVECHIDKCTDKKSHLTSGHRCGVCFEFGHGGWNHKDLSSRFALSSEETSHLSDQIPEEFQTCDCKYGHLHPIEGHFCKNCKKFGHRSGNCPERSAEELALYADREHLYSNYAHRMGDFI